MNQQQTQEFASKGVEKMNKQQVQEFAMHIIGFAGNAYSCFFQALEKTKQNEFDKSNELLEEGNSFLTKAHRLQTDLITKEAQGQESEYSTLMIHAQDHLMNAILVKKLIVELIDLNKKINKTN